MFGVRSSSPQRVDGGEAQARYPLSESSRFPRFRRFSFVLLGACVASAILQAKLSRAIRDVHLFRHARLFLRVSGGLERGYRVDTRYKSDTGNGQLAVSVLPFVGADGIKDAGTPEDVLQRFEELIGAYWEQNGFGQPGRTPSSTSVSTKNGVDYYLYELVSPHNLISACIVEGELYLMVASCGARSWKSAEGDLRSIVDSFKVPP